MTLQDHDSRNRRGSTSSPGSIAVDSPTRTPSEKDTQGLLVVVVKGWPRLSETFIAQELVALEEAGHRLALWSLRHPTNSKRHPLHHRLRGSVSYLPEYLHHAPLRVLRACLSLLAHPVRRRRLWHALRLWAQDLARDRTRNRVRRLGQACVLAAEMPASAKALYAHFLHTPASVARYAATMRGIPWACSAHAKDIWTLPDWEKREKLTSAKRGCAFVATCTAIGAAHLRARADTPQRVMLLYHGLDLSRFPAPPLRDAQAQPKPVRFLSVGRLVEKKGFDRLIAALALLPKELDWCWSHIGEGSLRKALQAQAQAAGVAPSITWHGACDQRQVVAAMRAADVFVLPSRIAADGDRDGLPNVLMEAASQRLAILATPVSAIPEFIEDGTHGLLCSDAPAQLARALLRLAQDTPLRARLAQAAYARLRQDFTMAPGIARLDRRLCALIQRVNP